MTVDWVDIAITILTAGLFALIGFVWRWSHKVTGIEKDIQDHKRRLRSMENAHEKVMDRMYSIAKDRASFMTRESYREDNKEMSRMIALAQHEKKMKDEEETKNDH